VKEVDLPYINDVAMFRSTPFHPVTMEPVKKSEMLKCIMEKKYGTGMILCKEKHARSRFFFTILGTIVLVIGCLLLFSIQVEVKHLDEIPVLLFLLSNIHFVFAGIAIAIIITAVAINHGR
jgi:hypothetical protein